MDKYDDLIDSRDVIDRIAEIETEAAGRYCDAHPEGVSWGEIADTESHMTYLDDEDAEELRILRDLARQGEDSAADWIHGETLIRDSYFKEYAMDLADDIGAVPAEYSWPTSCIDWDQAARELQMDYTPIEYDGVTYWIR